MTSGERSRDSLLTALLALLPVLAMLAVWFSSLSFVPVPWPDDSAFYFVAKEFFRWPPHWVMLPQAPFEPSYAIMNFNTMPLYPILIGVGRWIGIDGSFLLKIWPLAAWGVSGSLLGVTLFKRGLPFLGALIVTLGFSAHPALRWASVLVRPESLIGLFGMALVLGLSFGFPATLQARKLWNPVSALLALGAYAHFNAVHLLFPVILTYAFRRELKELVKAGLLASLYLLPWALVVLWHRNLFIQQMSVQWRRLSGGNDWLSTPAKALKAIFQDHGSPQPWPDYLSWAAVGIWILILAAIGYLVFTAARELANRKTQKEQGKQNLLMSVLIPSAGWVMGAFWLWNSKPEVWFTYYLNASAWCFAGVLLLCLYERFKNKKPLVVYALSQLLAILTAVFLAVDITQASQLARSSSWHWPVYQDYVECIDRQLVKLESDLGHPRPFRVWDPTPPDVLIELSRRHPDWSFSRTNDFWDRAPLALQHGRDVEAVVVTETVNFTEREISSRMEDHPEIQSAWMTWSAHFLNKLWLEPGWKPNRYLCQRGRWQAFIFMKGIPTSQTPARPEASSLGAGLRD